MAGIDLAATMDAIAANLEQITGLRVLAWPAESCAPPAGIVGYPEEIHYDETFNRGADRATFPIWIVLGENSTLAARDALSSFVSSAGAKEIKAQLDGRLPVNGTPTVQSCRVTSAKPDWIQMNNSRHLAALFELDVVA